MNQSELVDKYLDALKADPEAIPPSGLDAETAYLIRTLVVTSGQGEDIQAAKERVWSQVLFSLHCLPPDAPELALDIDLPLAEFEETPPPVLVPVKRFGLESLMMVAAAMIAFVLLTGMLLWSSQTQQRIDINNRTPPYSIQIDRGSNLFVDREDMTGIGPGGAVVNDDMIYTTALIMKNSHITVGRDAMMW